MAQKNYPDLPAARHLGSSDGNQGDRRPLRRGAEAQRPSRRETDPARRRYRRQRLAAWLVIVGVSLAAPAIAAVLLLGR